MSGILSTIIVLGALFVGWQVATGKMPEVEAMVKDALNQLGLGGMGKLVPTTPTGGIAGGGDATPSAGNLSAGKAGLIMKGTGKTWKAVDSGKKTRNYASGGSSGTTQWDIKGVGPITNLEVTCFVNVGSCGDEVSLKVYGPGHSDGACCWFIMDVNCNTGQFMMGGEGPHPKTTKNGLGTGKSMGSMKNKECGIKLVIYKSGSNYTATGYAFMANKWEPMMTKTFTQFGNSKKSSTPNSGATIQFRTDCSGVKYLVAEAAEIAPGTAAPTAKAAITFAKDHYLMHSYATQIQREPTLLESIVSAVISPPGIYYQVPTVA